MIPPIHPALRITDAAGAIGRDFHRWLQLIARALRGPFAGLFAPGPVAVTANEYAIHAEELVANGTDEAAIEGDGVLVVV